MTGRKRWCQLKTVHYFYSSFGHSALGLRWTRLGKWFLKEAVTWHQHIINAHMTPWLFTTALKSTQAFRHKHTIYICQYIWTTNNHFQYFNTKQQCMWCITWNKEMGVVWSRVLGCHLEFEVPKVHGFRKQSTSVILLYYSQCALEQGRLLLDKRSCSWRATFLQSLSPTPIKHIWTI